MEKLILKYTVAQEALESLGKLLDMIQEEENVLKIDFSDTVQHDEVFQIFRDSCIQRFEYSVDTVWKFLKQYFWVMKGVDQSHPKPVLRECFKAGLVSEAEVEVLIEMIDDRNMTSHAYLESVANRVFKNIPNYYKLMRMLVEKTKP